MKKQEKHSNLRPVSNSRNQLLETGLQGLKSTKAFTLVELIVVITILAILGTIAFISLQGYSKDARDSVRISDISKIKTSLELFQLDAGKYPETTEATNITYSGAIAWTQGTFGEVTFNNVTKLDKIPLDPVSDRQYVYSVTNTKQEYQIAGIMEGDEVSGLLNQTNATLKTAMLKISGNYNGKVLKVSTGGTDYVLAVPSIITSSGFTLEQIVAGKTLAYNGYKNLPAQYAGSAYEVLGDDEINLVNSDDLVIYSGDLKILSSTELVGTTARKNLIEKLKSAYSGTAITGIGEIAQIINTDTTDTNATEFLSTTIVRNNLGGSITVSSGGGNGTQTNSCATQPSYTYAIFTVGTPTSVNQEYVKDATNCGFTCTDGYTGANCEISPITSLSCTSPGQIMDATSVYGNCDDYDVIVCSGNGTGYTISSCNVGANESGIAEASYGYYFQWGNNGGTPNEFINPVSGTVNTLLYGPLNYYNSTVVIGVTLDSPYDWSSPQNNDLWGNTTNNIEARRGPCEEGYHIPTQSEWESVVFLGGWSSGTSMSSVLKLPFAGTRARDTGNIVNKNTYGYYWTSSVIGISGYNLLINNLSINPLKDFHRAWGHTIRCFKN